MALRSLIGLVLYLVSQMALSTGFDDIDQAIRTKDFGTAAKLLQSRAQKGDAEAQYRLAGLYRVGQGVKLDHKRAFRWLEKAASQEHIAASYQLGVMYEKGWGTDASLSEAKRWFQSAADGGSRMAKRKLAKLSNEYDTNANQESREVRQVKFRSAVRNNDVATAKKYLEIGISLSEVDQWGRRAIQDAVENGFVEISQLLLKAGAAETMSSEDKGSLFLLAARHGDIEIMKRLLEVGADLRVEDSNHQNALFIAVIQDRVETVRWLVKQGLNASRRNKDGETISDIAQRKNNKTMLAELRKHGLLQDEKLAQTDADIEALNDIAKQPGLYFGWSPLGIAVARGQDKIVDSLLAVSDIDHVEPDRHTALTRAISLGEAQTAKKLLDAGADWRIKGPEAIGAGTWALKSGNEKVVGLMLEVGAYQDGSKTDLRELFRWLAGQKSLPLLEQFIPETFSPLSKDESHKSILWYAIEDDWAEGVHWLLENGITFSDNDDTMREALFRAIELERADIVRRLLSIPNLARQKSPSENTALMVAAKVGNTHIVQALIEARVPIDAHNKLGNTALMIASQEGHLAMVDQLLKAGADAGIRNIDRQTAIDIALANGHGDIVELIESNTSAMGWASRWFR